ncbi:MAG: F0F1 ATP synthase subunit gamma [Candidatus Binatia bacterium]
MSNSIVIRLKNELQTTAGLMGLVDILKQVAAAQFYALDEKRRSSGWTTGDRPSKGRTTEPAQEESGERMLDNFFHLIPPEQYRHPFLDKPSPPLSLVIVTSDEGFLGGLNAAVIQGALSAQGDQQAELIVLGERGKMYLDDLKKPCTPFPGLGDQITSQEVERVRDYIVGQYLHRKCGRVVVFYPRLVSFTHQEVDSFQLLPYTPPSEGRDPASLSDPAQTILEPSAYSIIEYVVKLWLSRRIQEVFWQSRLSEVAARAMHLEASGVELGQQKKRATLRYFRNKHEVTDTSIRETYAGMVARKRRIVRSHR